MTCSYGDPLHIAESFQGQSSVVPRVIVLPLRDHDEGARVSSCLGIIAGSQLKRFAFYVIVTTAGDIKHEDVS